jgi:hypothetical protein
MNTEDQNTNDAEPIRPSGFSINPKTERKIDEHQPQHTD